jgi:lipopolysaccharide export system permease protein
MKTVRHLIYREVLGAIVLVAAGFLALFFFFDLVDELQYLGKSSGLPTANDIYLARHALLYVALLVPNHLYELLPISVLIGTIFVMSRLAQSSEYTILRTSGLGPGRALRLLLGLGAFFVVVSFLIGDYVAPASERMAQLLKARYRGAVMVGQTGAWLKERQDAHTFVVNVKTLSSSKQMRDLQIFEFDSRGFVASTTRAPSAEFTDDEHWLLKDAERAEFDIRNNASTAQAGAALPSAAVKRSVVPSFRWPTGLTQEMVSVALLKPDRMATYDLFNYIRHLDANGQTAQRYEIEFWRKVFYPLSCLVMVMLALPFAYLHFRSGSIATYVFAGVLLGISFFLMNNVFGYVGNLRNWQPWLAASTPGLLYMAISLAAFGWLVLRR